MKTVLTTIVFLFLFSLQGCAWTSSNSGECYDMNTLCQLSDSISFNSETQQYEVECDIEILENDTLKIYPGEVVKFMGYLVPGNTIQFTLKVYGCLQAIGTLDKQIYLGDPLESFSGRKWWNGLEFINTSANGESILKYCNIMGAVNQDWEKESALFCENSSPIIDHCSFRYQNSGEETGGACSIGLKGQSYPIVRYCTFEKLDHSVALWCTPKWALDSVNYPSALMIGCNILPTVQGFYGYGCDHDIAILWGGFLDNCYLATMDGEVDTSLGYPLDTIGDGICTTNSTFEGRKRFLLVDGVVNPRTTPIPVGINEAEADILPTTSQYLLLKRNYPNPLNSYTTIEFEVLQPTQKVSLQILDSGGNLIHTLIDGQCYSKGIHAVKWHADNQNGQSVSPGIYFYKLICSGQMQVKKAVVVKN